jgi:uncharacterized protein
MDLFAGPSKRQSERMTTPLLTARTQFGRKGQRGSHDRAVIDAILDEALICHVGFTGPAGPVVIPTAFVRIADEIVVHGATANAMLNALAASDVAIAVTLLDGLVLARTAFHHSVNYRSVVLFGRGTVIDDPARKLAASAALLERMTPGRAAACRMPNAKELRATLFVAVPIDEASAKIRSGPPLPDDGEDAHLPFWSGVIPLVITRGAPVTSPDGDHALAPAAVP